MLEVTHVSAGYGKVPVLEDISFFVDRGETVAILGPNGAGKSTLLKTISGMVRARSGKVCVDGVDISTLPPYQVIRHGLAYVPEGGRVFPNMTVYDNLKMGAYSNPAILKTGILEEVYQLFPLLRQRGSQYARTLSGGERQMLAIGRGLISRPNILMLDEPSLGLAPKLVDEIYDRIHGLKGSGLTVLLVEQNIHYALELANRAYVLESGKVVMEGLAKDMAANAHIQKFYLGL